MKRFSALLLVVAMAMSMTACVGIGFTPDTSDPIVYTGEFKVTKLEVYVDAGDYRYIMAVKNDDVAILFRVNSATYLKYDIGGTVSGEVKYSGQNSYYLRLDESEEWFYAIETIGFED